MKKFISLLLTVLMVATMFPTMSMADTQYEELMLTAENFTLSGTYSAIVTDGLTNKLFQKVVKVQRFDAVTAKFYIETAGTYSLQFLTGSASTDTGRYPVANIDGTVENLAHSNEMTWKSISKELSAGWHTVSLTTSGEWLPYFFNALFITNDESNELTVENDNDKFGAYVPDITAPVIGDSDIVTSFEGSECVVTFPAATGDEGEAIIYEYTIGDTTTLISDITSPVNIGELSGETTITLIASDKFGNSTSRNFTVTCAGSGGGEEPPVDSEDKVEELLLTAENFALSGTYSAIVTDGITNKLFNNSVKVQRLDAVTAKFYIETAGTYSLQFLTGSASTDTGRYPVANIDGTVENLAHSNEMTWKSISKKLSAGWHTVSLTTSGEWLPYFINALFITNDESNELTVDNDNDKYGAYVPDTTAPVIGDSDIVTSFEGSECVVTFPAATGDEGETIIYEYTIGDNTTLISDITSAVNVGTISGDTTITFTASDKFGNSASKSVTVSAPVTQWMLTWNNFVKPDDTNWTYDTTYKSLGSKSIKPNASYTKKAKAMIYVETDGNYAVWALNHNSGSNTPTRVPAIYIDGVKDTSTFNVEYAWKWAKGAGPDGGNGYWTLTKGWHTIEFGLSADWSPYYLDAIYVTGNLTETLDINSDDALLAAHGGSSVYVNGELYMAKGLEKAGVAVEDSCANITPVVANATGSAATVTVNGAAASWDVAASVDLANVVNTITIDSSDDTADCTFKVASVGKVINHADEDATVTGYAESEFPGADGTNAVSISGEGSAKFSAEGVTGNTEVWVYVIGAAANASLADVTVADATGTQSYNYTNTGATSQWVKLGEAYFSGAADEYVQIKANGSATVYVDSVKFKKADDFVLSSAQKVEENGTVKFVYEFYKQSASSKKPVAIIAGYDGTLLNTVAFNETNASDAGIYTFTTNALTVNSGITYRGYIWESFTSCKPLAADMN